jgi:hypothetical protein
MEKKEVILLLDPVLMEMLRLKMESKSQDKIQFKDQHTVKKKLENKFGISLI